MVWEHDGLAIAALSVISRRTTESNAAGVIGIGAPPSAKIFSAVSFTPSAATTSRLSRSMMALGVFAGGYFPSAFLNPLSRARGDHMIIAVGCLVATALAILASILTGLPLFRCCGTCLAALSSFKEVR